MENLLILLRSTMEEHKSILLLHGEYLLQNLLNRLTCSEVLEIPRKTLAKEPLTCSLDHSRLLRPSLPSMCLAPVTACRTQRRTLPLCPKPSATHTHVRAHKLTHTSAFTVNSLVSMVIAISHLAHYTMFMFICEYSGILSYICFI